MLTLVETETLLANAIVAEVEGAESSFVELSSALSHLYQLLLADAGWSEGWLDGFPHARLASLPDGSLAFAGLVAWWSGDVCMLESAHAVFCLNDDQSGFDSYVLCFRSRSEDRPIITADFSLARITRMMNFPEPEQPLVEPDWEYVFCRP